MMKKVLLSALALGMMSSVAMAAPAKMTDAQLDAVTAGASAGVGIGQFGLVNAAVLAIIAGIGVQNN